MCSEVLDKVKYPSNMIKEWLFFARESVEAEMRGGHGRCLQEIQFLVQNSNPILEEIQA